MVTDGRCYRKGSQRLGTKICSVLTLICTIIYLISCRYHKAYITVILNSLCQNLIPIVAVIAGSKVVSSGRSDILAVIHLILFRACLILACTDLRVSHIQE